MANRRHQEHKRRDRPNAHEPRLARDVVLGGGALVCRQRSTPALLAHGYGRTDRIALVLFTDAPHRELTTAQGSHRG
ncbi:hypothetical protein NUW54_g8926 [Trametes sanguinea]|uniref:Uncharacterized protein n=1 Tax=Trametes sanguinea TaxID=158606 RepID=A0ACC1PCF2_9APHY|nr:hypothetical protein NUW54_g8926 [Trametes sanguinea]